MLPHVVLGVASGRQHRSTGEWLFRTSREADHLTHEVCSLDQWLEDCRTGPVPGLRNFAVGLENDGPAVRAALALPWSNGPAEGWINTLKLPKRGAYGRMKPDLLRHRVLHAA